MNPHLWRGQLDLSTNDQFRKLVQGNFVGDCLLRIEPFSMCLYHLSGRHYLMILHS